MTLHLLAGDSYGVLINKLENIIIYKLLKKNVLTDDLKKEVLDFTDYLRRKGTRRNEIIHFLWTTDKNGKIINSQLLKRIKNNKITESNKPNNFKDLIIFADELMSASQKVIDFREKINSLILINSQVISIPKTIRKLLDYETK